MVAQALISSCKRPQKAKDKDQDLIRVAELQRKLKLLIWTDLLFKVKAHMGKGKKRTLKKGDRDMG